MSRAFAAWLVVVVGLGSTRETVHAQVDPLGIPLSQKPNIVLLVLDDQDAFTPFWDAMPQTRKMVPDRGLTFNRAFSTTPICTPGRVTILSGRQAHHTGVYTLVGPSGGSNFNGQLRDTLPVALNRLGYTNALIGKTWGSTQPDPGWDVWCALGGNRLYEGYGYEVTERTLKGQFNQYTGGTYSTDFIADRAIGFLQGQRGSRRPFFLYLAPTAPHLPLPPAPRHVAQANARWRGTLPHRADYNERDLSDKSGWLKKTGQARSAAVRYADSEYANRMGSLLAVDEMMGRIRRELVSQDEWDNTIVIVTSDNGYNLGAHRLIHKMAPYEESIRVPLAVAGPGIVDDEVDQLVGLHDLAPTLIQLGGGKPTWSVDGRSMVPLLRDGSDSKASWRKAMVIEYNAGGVTPGYNPGGAMSVGYSLDIPTYRGLRTADYKYIRWSSTGEEELYDLNRDPLELNNLLERGGSRTNRVRDALRKQLADALD